MKRLGLFVLLVCVTALSFASEWDTKKLENWHQWRGPNADGVAPKGNPPTNWSETENIKWKADIPGIGCSTPIIWENQVFILSAEKTDRVDERQQETSAEESDAEPPRRRRFRRFRSPEPTNYYNFNVTSYNRNTGDILWKKTATEVVPHEGHHQTSTFASASPITDGEYLYVSFGSRGIYCYDLQGNLQWEKDLGNMQTRNSFGEGASPTLYKDNLIVNWDHEEQSYIYNLDAKTGDIKWQKERDEVTTWATPLVVEHDGKSQVVVNGTNRSRSYDLDTGELIWQCGGQTDNPIPSPIRYDSFVICLSGFRGEALYAIPLTAKGDITGTDKIRYSYNNDTPYVPSALLYDKNLYFARGNTTILTCLNVETGKPVYGGTRLPDLTGTLYASPVGADGRIYFLTRDGKSLVIKHGPELQVLAWNELDDEFNASPAVAGNTMFLRGKNTLYCIEEG